MLLDREFINLAIGIGSAVALFIYGIEHLSYELREKISRHLKGVFSAIVRNKYLAALISALATAMIQSSSATTVITVSLVESGIISFRESLGLIAGANVGTTITAQLVALNLSTLGPALILTGFLTTMFGGRYSSIGKPLFYLGFLLFSLNLLGEEAVKAKGTLLAFQHVASRLNNPIVGIVVGTIATAVVQSSSVITGIVVVLAQTGILNINQSLPIVLGANIGTTVTCLLAASRMRVFAKKTALAHLLFNVGGVLLFLPFLQPLEQQLQSWTVDPGEQVAMAHALFNITACIVFLLLSDLVANALDAITGAKKEHIYAIQYLTRYPGLKGITKEITREVRLIIEMLDLALGIGKKSGELTEITYLHDLVRFIDEKIKEHLLHSKEREIEQRDKLVLYKLTATNRYIAQLVDEWAQLVIELKKREDKNQTALAFRIGLVIRKLLKKLIATIEGKKVSIKQEKKRLAELNDEIYSSIIAGSGASGALIGIAEDIAGKVEIVSQLALQLHSIRERKKQ